MAGVAARLCGDRSTLASLGYTLAPDGGILDENQNVISRSGSRIPIVNDLSPAATLIAAGYNLTTHPEDFPAHANRLMAKFNDDFGWMYKTHEPGTSNVCAVDFTVWSIQRIFLPCIARSEIDYWELAYDEESGKIEDLLTCPHCSVELAKRALVRRTTSYFDKALQETRTRQVLRPVEIHYQKNGERKTKKPDSNDLATLGTGGEAFWILFLIPRNCLCSCRKAL